MTLRLRNQPRLFWPVVVVARVARAISPTDALAVVTNSLAMKLERQLAQLDDTTALPRHKRLLQSLGTWLLSSPDRPSVATIAGEARGRCVSTGCAVSPVSLQEGSALRKALRVRRQTIARPLERPATFQSPAIRSATATPPAPARSQPPTRCNSTSSSASPFVESHLSSTERDQ